MTATASAPQTAVQTRYSISEMIRAVGTDLVFAFGDKFKFLLVTWQNQVVRTYVLNAIAFATKAEVEALPVSHREKLLAILLWDSKRLNGTWRNAQGEVGKLRFADSWDFEEDVAARNEYWKRLNMAITNLRRGGR